MHQKITLANGLRIITENMPHTGSVCVGIFIGTGSRYEAEEAAGISHFIEHLSFRGTAKRKTAREISAAIEGVGGIINGGTDKEMTVYWCKVARDHLRLAIDVLTDMLLGARFDAEDIEKERQVIIEEINMCLDSPPQRAAMLIDEIMWPSHPLGRDIAGSRKSVSAISRDMLLDYLASHYLPQSTVVSIAGDIQPDEAVAAVGEALGSGAGNKPAPTYLAYQAGETPRVCIESRDTEQAHLCLALPGLSLFHPRRLALDLLNVVLGEGMSSRLFSEIRDRLGLAYSVYSYSEHFLDTGAVAVCASVDPKKLATAIRAILEQLARLKTAIPEPELAKAKEMSRGRLRLRMEDSRNVAGWSGAQEALTGKILRPEEVIAIIEAITAGELKKLAAEIFTGSHLHLAVVGPIPGDEPLEELLRL